MNDELGMENYCKVEVESLEFFVPNFYRSLYFLVASIHFRSFFYKDGFEIKKMNA
jgi:hypothetical protein